MQKNRLHCIVGNNLPAFALLLRIFCMPHIEPSSHSYYLKNNNLKTIQPLHTRTKDFRADESSGYVSFVCRIQDHLTIVMTMCQIKPTLDGQIKSEILKTKMVVKPKLNMIQTSKTA